MRKSLFLILPIFLLSLTFSAQSNWQTASLTTTKGEIFTGQVDDRKWSDFITEIDFRADKKSSTQSFDVSNIAKLIIGNQEYEGKAIQYNASPRNKQALVTEDQRIDQSAFGLLKVLIGGSVDLMQYYDERGRDHYYLRDSDGNIAYLDFGTYRREFLNKESRVIEVNKFHEFLLKELKSCGTLSALIVSTTYNEKSLLNLFKEYYTCTGEVIDQPIVPSSQWTFGPTVGYAKLFSVFRYHAIDVVYRDESFSMVPIGGRVLYYPSGLDGRSAFFMGMEYFQYESKVKSGQGLPFKQEQTVRLSIGPRFYFTEDKNTLYGEFSVGYDWLLLYEQAVFGGRSSGGKIIFGLNLGCKFSGIDLSLRSFIANRNLIGMPRETLYGIGSTVGYNF